MQVNSPQQNQSPSLMQQDLPSYDNHLYLSSFHSPDTTYNNQFSFNYTMQKLVNPFQGTTLQEQYKRLQELKVNVSNQRNKLITDYQLQHTNREAISTLPNYQQGEQGEQRVVQDKVKLKKIEQYNEQLKFQLLENQLLQKKLQREKRVIEEVAQFQAKLKGSVNNQGQGTKLLLEKADDPINYNQQLLRTLMQNLKKRSQSTLHKLKPYLQYNLNSIKQTNQTHKQNNDFLQKRRSRFSLQIALSNKLLMEEQERNRNYELEDQIEDQLAFRRQIKAYQQQIRKDDRVRLNRVGSE